MEKPKILIVDDDEDIRTQMKWGLADEYQVFLAEDRRSALETFRREQPALVTLDLGLPPRALEVEEGFLALQDLLELDPRVKVVVITGREEREHAVQAVGQGAHDFFSKPIVIDELRVTLKRARQIYELEREHESAQLKVGEEGFERMLGASPSMQQVFATIRKVAGTEAPVLVVGESGSGKELVANAIHTQSGRADGRFVVINCGAIPENLLESELFGHEKGSFTGAHAQRKGRIELAQGGTLFLDEVGELPLLTQVKLLRFLQEHTIERVGGREQIQVDTRVIAATNVDLEAAMRAGRFREDLYYRLGVVVIRVPPLRERGDDIAVIARAFLAQYAAEVKKRVAGFTAEAQRALETHAWPGNVRELENRVKRAVIMAEGGRLTPADLELTEAPGRVDVAPGLREARKAVERDVVVKALAKHKGNMTRTAAELGVSRPTLYELIDRLDIPRE